MLEKLVDWPTRDQGSRSLSLDLFSDRYGEVRKS